MRLFIDDSIEDEIEKEFKSLTFNNEYVQTKIETKYGSFFIRVYEDFQNKETFVLWKGDFSNIHPPLVRVHSECITGDLLGSLKCDCGKQLQKAIKLVQEHGGMIIYLRQEGRGIGLFEKIKAYQLQSKGYDTFEANTTLGHKPDARTYEMVKVVLDDFNLNRIRILTNNPSKVSEITKQGIEIVEHVPLYIRPNKHNRKYYETKRKKFHHFFDQEKHKYFYQFHIDEVSQLKEIKLDIIDPFCQACVGVTTTISCVRLEEERLRIERIYKEAKDKKIEPILHLSFDKSIHPLEDLSFVKDNLPFIHRIQLNDLNPVSYSFLQTAYQLFKIDLPLSAENFDLILSPKIKSLVKRHQGLILIDNSKGKGKTESFNFYRNKIDLLFDHDLRNICLCGGFGPNNLDTFFSLCRYYRVNFSIDAESKMKRDGKFDTDLINQYLSELIFLPKLADSGVVQTKSFLKKQSRTKWDSINIQGEQFLIHPNVFHSGKFPSSKWYADKVSEFVRDEKDFCEVGCGSGLTSCLVALRNPSIQVIATDINEDASYNTRINAQNLGVSDRLVSFHGDVFDSLNKEYRFDSIFWAMPFGFLDSNETLSLEEMQVFDPGYRSIYKFISHGKRHLKPGGRILIGFSNDLGRSDLLYDYSDRFGLKLKQLGSVILKEEKNVEFSLLEGRFSKNKSFISPDI